MNQDARIYVAGHLGMVGSACLRRLKLAGHRNLLLRSRAELDLRNKEAVHDFFAAERPDYVILAAAKVGGILANSEQQAEFLLENLEIQNNVIMAAHKQGVKKFCFLGSSCVYPRLSPQPIREEYLLSGALEPTNEAYALAKISGLKLVSYLHKQYGFPGFSLMPCNLYGTNDNYHPEHSHVFAAFIRRFCLAVRDAAEHITLWGSGSPLREFMHVDDLAEAVYYFIQLDNLPQLPLNVGAGKEISIKQLAELIAVETGFTGKINWDPSKPDGMPRKLMDSGRANALGWSAKISLQEGIRRSIEEFRELNKL
ncbi:MAG: GDP-L-fucose synthase [Oligosphaeraceae bacterium]|nr:GDP-L-fucose synthase [Oligosphaeraceae bacterium]